MQIYQYTVQRIRGTNLVSGELDGEKLRAPSLKMANIRLRDRIQQSDAVRLPNPDDYQLTGAEEVYEVDASSEEEWLENDRANFYENGEDYWDDE